MANVRVQDSTTSATNPVLEEIMKMEARLTASITTNRDKDMSEIETRLNANIKSTIDTSIKEAIQTMQTSICSAVQNNPQIKAHSIELKGLREENSRLNRRVQQLSAEQARIKRQLTKIESRNLDCSLIIKGIAEDYKESETAMTNKIYQTLANLMQGETFDEKLLAARRITIKECRRLGRYFRSRTRPISLELMHKEDINFILDNRFDLAKGVYVDREYPAETERKRKTLLPILKAAKRLPDYKKQSRLEDDKLVLKGKPYTVTMLNQLPDELNSFKVTSKENPTVVGFFGEINPLSNFFPALFTHEGSQYISSEQFIQASKAQYFGDIETHSKIMGCTTSFECKTLSKQIRNMDEEKWEEVAGETCYPGIKAKFCQNPHGMDCLIRKTGNKRIVECATDRLWATGLPLSDPSCLDETKWLSQGILGRMLESIRNDQLLHLTSSHGYQSGIAQPPLASSHESSETSASSIFNVNLPNCSRAETDMCPNPSRQISPMQCLPSVMETHMDSASASTTPVSDTTETDTDSSDTTPYRHPNCPEQQEKPNDTS